jgi:hypothetical protein
MPRGKKFKAEEIIAQADDATDASLSGSEMRSVGVACARSDLAFPA